MNSSSSQVHESIYFCIRPVNIPIKNDDFFEDEEDVVSEKETAPVYVPVEPVSKPTFTPIQARNEAMRKVPEKSNKREENGEKIFAGHSRFCHVGIVGRDVSRRGISFS